MPAIFSLMRNPSEVIAFINQVRKYGQARINIDLRFDDVTEIGIEAIAALVAAIEFHNKYSIVTGNLPTDPNCRNLLIQSGFLSRTNAARWISASEKSGLMARKTSKRVAPEVARELIRHGTKMAFGQPRRCQAAQRAFLEGMQNTYDHADRQAKGEESWLAVAFADANAKRVSFVLVDSGVGIFKSVRMNRLRAALRAMGIEKNTDVLRDLLSRRIPSSTGLSYRGRGLPSFGEAVARGTLKNVTFVANDVIANVNSNDYRLMSESFDGTLLYWEIES